MKEQLQNTLSSTIKKMQIDGKLPSDITFDIKVEHTKDQTHGDFTTNLAMILAKIVGQKPKDLAQAIIDHLTPPKSIETVEIAGPGFINFYLSTKAAYSVIEDILHQEKFYGRSTFGANKKINIEFVSANPTGPLHVGHGRGAAFGDTLANILEALGYQVDREYYVNDAGRQMHILATSIWLRYLSFFDELPHFPVNAYRGEYVIAIAKKIQINHGNLFIRPLKDIFAELPKDEDQGGDKEIYIDALVECTKKLLGEQDYTLLFDTGTQAILADIKEDLAQFGINFQRWFSESSLVPNGNIVRGINLLKEKGYLYQQDGAWWFRATTLGDEKDRVVIRKNGQTTYFASDIAYHLNKYERGYDQIIDILGADHHGYAPRIKAFLQALDLDSDKFKVLLVQFAVLYRNKQKVSMSTRSGDFITLRELRQEVGNDAARFFYIMRKNDQHLDFDLDLAKSKSTDNPVYYIQYAHARICSVMRQLIEKKWEWLQKEGLEHLHLLQEKQESQLIYRLLRYAETLQIAANNFSPHVLTHYLQELANDLHVYYNAQQFLVPDKKLRNARLCLIMATKQILNNGLTLLGISSPEEM
jgi:arginyl-tRNA synthetase